MAHEPGSHQDRRLLSAPDRAAPRRAWPLRQPLRSRNPTCRRRVVHGRPGLSIAHPTAWSDPWIALPAATQGRAQAGAMSRGGGLRRMRRHAAGLAHVSPVGGRGAERGEPGVRVHSEGLCARLSVAPGELSGGILRQRGPFAVARGGYALERSGARNPVAAPLLHDLAPRCRMAHARTMKLLVLGNTGQLGASKYAGELLARLGQPDTIVIHTCGLYGGETGSRSKRGNFVLSVLRESESESQLEVSSEQIVNPTYAGDLAAATLALLAARPEGGLYHLAAEGRCAWSEFAE